MNINNSLISKKANDKVVEFEVNGQTVKLSPAIIRNYLVNGNGNVSDQEVVMFLNLCKFNRLNPFLQEAYLIKYGSSPATMVVGKDAITKRAMRNPNYEGQQAGVVVLKEDGELENRIGTIHLDNESLVGGWACVYVKGYKHPIEITVQFDEYVQMKDGKATSNWKAKPGTMIRKVALTQALREAFPEDLGSMYAPEEMGVPDSILDVTPVSDEPPVHVDESTGEVIEHQPGGQESDPEAAFFGNEG
ncbi:phage recombination protein Bet [Flavonifractor plautii]|uniref:phage recombination protein Bet n=1 Tax=Flavonifractor plautii TaxID=292800 RepID=UPI0018990490|nr:phage recombination protein Bet [Flavonifractor plautii]